MDKKDAIDCIQALLDVVKLRGCAYVYRRSGGVAELANVLACLKNSEPVVRCKNCEYTAPSQCEGAVVCTIHGHAVNQDGFCSDGEPREVENNV